MSPEEKRIKKLEEENARLRSECKKQYPKYDADKDITYLSKTEWRYGDVRDFYPYGC